MSLIRRVAGLAGELRGDTVTQAIADQRRSTGTWAGVDVSDDRALQLSAVWSCVSLVADSLAMLPVDVFRGIGPTKQPIATPRVLDEPFVGIDYLDWMHMGAVSLEMRGNHYGLITERDGLAIPTQIMPVHPYVVRPFVVRETGELRYRILGDDYPARDVFHVKGMTWPGRLDGLSPIGYQAQSIGAGLAMQEYAARFFGDSATPSGMLTTEQKLTREEAETYQDLWIEAHGSRRRKPAVMGGGLKFEAISIAPEDAQFLETRKWSRSEIAGIWRVPPHLVSDAANSPSAWGTGMEELGTSFVVFTLGIRIARYERAFSRMLARPRYVKLNVGALMRGRMLDQAQVFKIWREIGLANTDELRALLDWAPLPDGKGEDYTLPLNQGAIPSGGVIAGGGLVAGAPDPSAVTQGGA